MSKKYAPIWEALKQSIVTGKLSVTLCVPVRVQPLVIKEVIRCKDLDVLFKFDCAEKKRSYRIAHAINGSQVKIFLILHVDTKILSAEDF